MVFARPAAELFSRGVVAVEVVSTLPRICCKTPTACPHVAVPAALAQLMRFERAVLNDCT
jgi:hypothetical protein